MNRKPRLAALAASALAVGVGTVAAPAALAPAQAASCQKVNEWCKIPGKKGVKASAAVVKNDHDVNKAAGVIKIQHTGKKTSDKAYVSYRPAGGRFGVGRAAWYGGPQLSPGGQNSYWWDFFYYSAWEPYAFEFRICIADAGFDTCGDKLTIKDPKNSPF